MLYLILGLVLFFTTHFGAALRSRDAGNIRDRLGYGPYMGVFSILSIIGLGLIIWGYGQARLEPANVVLWVAPEWTRHIILALMLFSLIFLAAAYAPTGYIKKAVKHPMVLAVKIWAASHMIYNGDLASVLLFAAFLAFGVLSRIRAAKRGDKGPVDAKPNIIGDVAAIVVGAGVYVALIMGLHTILTGVPAASFG